MTTHDLRHANEARAAFTASESAAERTAALDAIAQHAVSLRLARRALEARGYPTAWRHDGRYDSPKTWPAVLTAHGLWRLWEDVCR
jgi:hypothetical protein